MLPVALPSYLVCDGLAVCHELGALFRCCVGSLPVRAPRLEAIHALVCFDLCDTLELHDLDDAFDLP